MPAKKKSTKSKKAARPSISFVVANYMKANKAASLDDLRAELKKHRLRCAESALRWRRGVIAMGYPTIDDYMKASKDKKLAAARTAAAARRTARLAARAA